MTATSNTTTQFFTKRSNRAIKKVSEFEFIVEKDQAIGMRIPVRIYANENLISNMAADRTVDQAINVATLSGVQKNFQELILYRIIWNFHMEILH